MILLLVVIGFVVLAPWPPIFFVEGFVQAFSLTHGMLAAFMNGAGAVHELRLVGVIAALSANVDGVDRVARPTSAF